MRRFHRRRAGRAGGRRPLDHPAGGKSRKFIDQIEQITFNGPDAAQRGQTVLFITERAVLELTPEGLALTEIAPSVDLARDVLAAALGQ